MDGRIEIRVNGKVVRVPADVSLAAALLDAGTAAFRASIHGAPRGPLCGMGVCHECRVTINGVPHRRSCLEPVVAGMEVVTGE
ncbi:MAG TPA: (2Fe-2S)-binding protein [Longimicrobiales bacterium]